MTPKETAEQIAHTKKLIDMAMDDIEDALAGSAIRGRIYGKLHAAIGNIVVIEGRIQELESKERIYDAL